MYRRIWIVLLIPICAAALQAQEFRLFDRNVQVHGFASQGFVHTDETIGSP